MVKPGDILDYRGAPAVVVNLLAADERSSARAGEPRCACRYLRHEEVRRGQVLEQEAPAPVGFILTWREARSLPVIRQRHEGPASAD